MTESDLRTFFDAYGAAFAHTETEIATFYAAPCMTARQGAVRLHATRADVERFFGAVLDQYRSQGISQGDLRSFTWQPLGANACAATIAWAYRNAAGDMLFEWTFTYTLYRGAEGWKILLQTMHDAAPPAVS